MADRTVSTELWGEIPDALPKTPIHHTEISEPKPAEYEIPTLHQPSSEHHPPKDELPARFMASVKPPLDRHSQNLTLHCIELQHHKRRMRLMLMAAQHQYGEGMKVEGLEPSSLPAHPPPPSRFCSSQGIVTPPTQSTILSRAQESISSKEPQALLTCAELDNVSNRHLLMRAVASMCAMAGFEMACESTLEILTDLLDDFNTRLCRLLRAAVDNEALNGKTGFPDAMEYALYEIGLGGCAALHKYWTQSVQDYVQRLDQEDQEMIQEYKAIADPTARSVLPKSEEGANSLGYLIKEEGDTRGGGVGYRTFSGKDSSEPGSELSNLSPYGIAANGNNTGEANSDPTSPQWGMSYIKAGGDEEPYDDPMNVVPATPQPP